jgi:hypothetical protein
VKHPTLPILAGAALLVLVLGAALVVRRGPRDGEATPAPPRNAPSAPEAESRELKRAMDRIATLEAELERIRATQAQSEKLLRDLKPFVDQVEAARKQVLSPGGTSPGEPRAFSTSMMGPGAAADLLGLDATRKDDFKRVFDETVDKIRALEAARAKVSVDGKKTRIEVPAFRPEAEALYEGWLQWARGFFTPAEKETFNKQRMFDGLFGPKRGLHDRVILLERPGDGTLVVHETDAGGSSGRINGAEDDGTMAAYAHLLKKR